MVDKIVPVCIPVADDPTRTTRASIAATSATTGSTRMCQSKIASGTRSIRTTARSGSARKWAFRTSPALGFLPHWVAIRRTATPKGLAIDGVDQCIRRGGWKYLRVKILFLDIVLPKSIFTSTLAILMPH